MGLMPQMREHTLFQHGVAWVGAEVTLADDPAKAKAGLAFASEPINYDRQDIDQQRQLLVDRFAGSGWQCDALLTAPALVLVGAYLLAGERGPAIPLGHKGSRPTAALPDQ